MHGWFLKLGFSRWGIQRKVALPPLSSAGNVLRPSTALALSIRLPPNADAAPALAADPVVLGMCDFFRRPTPFTADCVIDTTNVFEAVLNNLIKNAIQAMPGGGHIYIRTFAGSRHVCLTVEDEGKGIPVTVIDDQGEEHQIVLPSGSRPIVADGAFWT